MSGTTMDFERLTDPELLARDIANKYREWELYKEQKTEEWKETRNYVYATDTTTTSNALLPWSNTTVTPKLTQIADNLHANYFATLFPSKDWVKWEANSRDSAVQAKQKVIKSYMQNKVRQSGFEDTCSKLLWDYILYGNCFGIVEYENNALTKEGGLLVESYVGPKLKRISPFDIVFNPTAASFKESPKIIRQILTLGEVQRIINQTGDENKLKDVFKKCLDNRAYVNSASGVSWEKSEAYIADGFSDIRKYYESSYVEILTFYGDIYDQENKEFLTDRIITVVDRCYISANKENPSWLGSAPIFHVGWRERPDNLYAMGPLDNLVGLQYRIDHLENLRADVFDQIAYPITMVVGDVEEWDYTPGSRIYCGVEGSVSYLHPDPTALQADTQIAILEQRMEEMAGAPKQAMGIRTPGEKTAFEVQSLENSASRIFQHKVAHFERVFLEPVLNTMLEVGRRNLTVRDNIKILDEGVAIFKDITAADLAGPGKIVPVGARHFAERARRVQQLQQLIMLKGDPTIAPHISGKTIAKILSEELEEPEIYGDNVALQEQAETAEVAQELEVLNQESMMAAQEAGV